MNVGVLVILTLFISGMLFLVQRSERKRRLVVALFMLIPAEMIRRYVFYRSVSVFDHPFTHLTHMIVRADSFAVNIHREAWIALILALVLNLLFWLFVGRYNPVHSSDEIQVIGMDD